MYPDVVNDILSNERYAGAIESIRVVTDVFDAGYGVVITFLAFLIIMVAMLKNVLAGAYCAYPKFWDHVDDAHREVEGTSWAQQLTDTFNPQTLNSGSIASMFYRILPNIKKLTDFEGATVKASAYWLKAIPLMILSMSIGAFIYNGFYRDTAGIVIDFGSEMISRVLLNGDPVAAFDRLTGMTGRPTFESDDSNVYSQQMVNEISVDIYTTVIGRYTDITSAEAKRQLASAIESKANAFVADLEGYNPDYITEGMWDYEVRVSTTAGQVDTSNVHNKATPDGLHVNFVWQFDVMELGFSSNRYADSTTWIRVLLVLEKQVDNQKHGSTYRDIALTANIVGAGAATYVFNGTDAPTGLAVTVPSSDTLWTVYSGDTQVGTANVSDTRSGITVEFSSEVTVTGGLTLKCGGTGISLLDNTTNRRHYITSLVVAGVGSGVPATLTSATAGGSSVPFSSAGIASFSSGN